MNLNWVYFRIGAIGVSTNSALPIGVWVLTALDINRQPVYKSQIAIPMAMPMAVRFKRYVTFSDKNMYFSTQDYGNVLSPIA